MKRHHFAIVLWALSIGPSGAQAQVTRWTEPGTGSWFVAGNWDNGVPVAGGDAFVDNGGTAQIISASTPALDAVTVGSSASSDGHIVIIDGNLTTTFDMHLGAAGTGHLVQSGVSTLITPALCLGCYGSVANGTMVLNGGNVSASLFIRVGATGTGLVTQWGGTITTPYVQLGLSAGGVGTWQMNGGSLNVGNALYVGNGGSGHFTQYDPATVDTDDLLLAWTTSNGTYTLGGGTLTANYIGRGSGATGVFTMNGGRLDVGQFGGGPSLFPLTVNGGTLAPGGGGPGTTTIIGDHTQLGAAVLEIQLNGPTVGAYDRLAVHGDVTLSHSTLDLVLGYVPSAGETFWIVDNDDVDPITGTFAGLPEGSTVAAVFSLITYGFDISYAGGTGNDVVLTAFGPSCVEPPDVMAAWWPLDEMEGTIAEELVSGNDGTHANGPTPLGSERVGNSLCFDGFDDYVEVPDAPELDFDTGDFSIDAWVKTTDDSGVKVIVEKREDPASPTGVIGYSMYLYNGELGFQLADGDGTSSCACTAGAACTNYASGAPGFVADGLWHHVAVTLNRTDPIADGGVFYVDGAPVGNFEPLCRPESISNASPLRIGRPTPFSGGNFDGCIDEVELFDRELTPFEVATIFGAGILGKCKCDCPADVNGDGFVNGLDIDAFTRCILQTSTAGDHCSCADMTRDGIVDQDDTAAFVDAVLNGGPC